MDAVITQLGLEQVLLVAHDASGPPAVDWALAQPERVAGLVLSNTYYCEMPTLRPPEVQQARDEEAFQAACKLQSVVKIGRAGLSGQGCITAARVKGAIALRCRGAVGGTQHRLLRYLAINAVDQLFNR